MDLVWQHINDKTYLIAGGNNKNWIHSPDTLLNGHVVYLVKVRNWFFTLSDKETLWLLWINIRFVQGAIHKLRGKSFGNFGPTHPFTK